MYNLSSVKADVILCNVFSALTAINFIMITQLNDFLTCNCTGLHINKEVLLDIYAGFSKLTE